MRFCRFSVADRIAYGVVDTGPDDLTGSVTAIEGHPFAAYTLTSARFALSAVRLLPPVLPSKIIGIGKNYADHAREMGGEAPSTPVLFLKPSTSVIGPDDQIVLPPQSQQVEHEGELAVVIGRVAKEIAPERADEVILGYSCANDVTARDLQRGDGQWARAKGFDSFCPFGPWITTDLDARDLAIETTVGDEVRQSGRTSQMVHSVADLVSFVSSVMTLIPGDLILTGTPAGVGPLRPGDVVSVRIDGVGTLTNRVADSE
jgi:2-keto-4-pentenoate hydratase/2-oxohepta-3-ene-1,7-dioic acid hydratase in catechol pathway